MSPATRPRPAGDLRVLVLDTSRASERAPVIADVRASALHTFLRAGDLVVVNDAATIPASLATRDAAGSPVEVRLAGPLEADGSGRAVLLGAGDHRTPTEERPPPPRVAPGDRLQAGRLRVEIVSVTPLSPRLVDIRLSLSPPSDQADVLRELWRHARPVQYAYVEAPLALWDVQNVFAGEPWAVEMPSAGRAIDGRFLDELRARGVGVASVTHAAGLSHVGDEAVDAALPFPERTRTSAETAARVRSTRARGGRVIAIGTSVVRALEAAARASGAIDAFDGTTDLRIAPGTRLEVVDALLTGVHEPGTSHHSLVGAFLSPVALEAAARASEEKGLLVHELGDAWLLLRAA